MKSGVLLSERCLLARSMSFAWRTRSTQFLALVRLTQVGSGPGCKQIAQQQS